LRPSVGQTPGEGIALCAGAIHARHATTGAGSSVLIDFRPSLGAYLRLRRESRHTARLVHVAREGIEGVNRHALIKAS